MPPHYPATPDGLQAAPVLSHHLRQRLAAFVAPLLIQLDVRIDARLVRTFLATLEVLILVRNRAQALLLSELGGYLLGPHQAPAGTKRLSNLLRCPKWTSALLDLFLWRQAEQRREQLQQAGETAYLLWDESVIEKHESRRLEGLCPVRSSKAARRLAIKPGYYHPPTRKPIFVPGLQWLALLLVGKSGPPSVVTMRFFSSRGQKKTTSRRVQAGLLRRCANVWLDQVVHIFDRGFSGSPWLGQLLEQKLRFVVRWPARYLLCAAGTPTNTWKLVRGKKSLDKRLGWDARKRSQRLMGVLFREVTHPEYPDTRLWLVVCRPGKGRTPWYLLTNEPITEVEQAWSLVLAYARRWQIEMAFRYNKSELAMESPRLWEWERRIKLLLMVTLVYAFLLSLLREEGTSVCSWLLRYFCHRTGQRSREVSAPLYRLRAALSRLWLAYPASASIPPQDSG